MIELKGVYGCLKSNCNPPPYVKPLTVSEEMGTVTDEIMVEFPVGCYCSSKLFNPP